MAPKKVQLYFWVLCRPRMCARRQRPALVKGGKLSSRWRRSAAAGELATQAWRSMKVENVSKSCARSVDSILRTASSGVRPGGR